MTLDEVIRLFGWAFIPMIFLINRDFLRNKLSGTVILTICIVMAVTSIYTMTILKDTTFKSWTLPIYGYTLFYGMDMFFKYRFKRQWTDNAGRMNSRLLVDGFFSMIYFGLTFIGPMAYIPDIIFR